MNIKELIPLMPRIERDLPETPPKLRQDVFSISGFPHWETVLSNWFAFFLDKEQKHGLTGLFAQAFRKAIIEAEGKANLDWLNDQVSVVQEQNTVSGKFIDLVVYDNSGEKERHFENALVIEHKVNAALYNHLEDYYKSIIVSKDRSKQGVVLSARKLVTNNTDFVNVTYELLVKYLQKEMGKHILNVDLQIAGYLKDFINNLNRMGETKDNEALAFCFEYGSTIQRLEQVRQDAEKEMVTDIQLALADSDYQYFRSYPGVVTVTTKDGEISIYLYLDNVFSNKIIRFHYWLGPDLAANWKLLTDVSELKEQFGRAFKLQELKEANSWAEILRGEIPLESIGADFSIGEEVVKFLKEQLNPVNETVYSLIEKHIAK